MDILQKEYPQFELVGIESYTPNLKSVVQAADRVLIMTSKMSHPTEAAARKAAKNHDVTRVNGGLSAIRHQLNIWLSGFKEDASKFFKGTN